MPVDINTVLNRAYSKNTPAQKVTPTKTTNPQPTDVSSVLDDAFKKKASENASGASNTQSNNTSSASSPTQSQSNENNGVNNPFNDESKLLNFPQGDQTKDFGFIEHNQLEKAAPLGVATNEVRDNAINEIKARRALPSAQLQNAFGFISTDLNSLHQPTDRMTNAQRVGGVDVPYSNEFQENVLTGKVANPNNSNITLAALQTKKNMPLATYANQRISELTNDIDSIKAKQYVDVPVLGGGSLTMGTSGGTIKEKVKNFDELQKEIDAKTAYLTDLKKSASLLNSYQVTKNMPLPKDQSAASMKEYYRELGLGANEIDNPEGVEKKRSSILSGTEAQRHPELVDLENYRLENEGLNAKLYAAQADLESGQITPDQYNIQLNDVKAQKDNLFDLHPLAKQVAQMQAVGQVLMKQRNIVNEALNKAAPGGAGDGKSLWENIVHYGFSDDEIKSAGKELGMKDQDIKDIINRKNDIPGTSFIGNFYNKFIVSASQHLISPLQSLIDKGRLRNDNEIESEQYEWNKKFQLNPEQQPNQPETISDIRKQVKNENGQLINNPNFLHEVANPEAGNHNWGYGDINRVGDALGTLGELWLETELGGEFAEAAIGRLAGGASKVVNAGQGLREVNSLTTAQKSLLGNYAASYASGYNGYKKMASQYAPDEYSQEVLAHTMTMAQALVFGVFPNASPQKLFARAFGQSDQQLMKSFAEMIPENGVQDISKSKWKSFLTKAIKNNILLEGLKENAKATALMTANQLADIGVQAMYNPQSVDKLNAGHELLNEAVKNFVTFAPISLFGATVSHLSSPHLDQTRFEKEAIYRMGQDPIQYQHYVDEQVKAGKMSQSDANKRIQLVNSMGDIIKSGSIPEGLSNGEKIEYGNNILWKNKLASEIEGLKKIDPNNKLIARKEEQIKELQQRNDNIFDNSDGQERTSNGSLVIRPAEEKNSQNEKNVPRGELLSDAKDAILQAEGTNYALQPLKDAAQNDPALFEKYFTNLTRQLQDPNSRESALASYPKEVTDLADEYGKGLPENTKAEIEDLIPSYDQAVLPTMQKIEKGQAVNENELEGARGQLYDLLDKVDKSDYSKEEKASMNALIEPLITKIESYDNRTKTETRTVTEKVPVEVPRNARRETQPVSKSLDQFEGSSATIESSDGKQTTGSLKYDEKSDTYGLYNEDGEKIAVLGNKTLTDRDISLPSKQEVPRPIQTDNEGNVKSITLQLNKVDKENGGLVPDRKVTIEFKDPEKALDYAIRLRAEQIGEAPEKEFETVWQEIQKQISEEVPVKEISSPNIKTKQNESNHRQNEDEAQEPKERQREANRQVQSESDNGQSQNQQRNANGENKGQENASQRDGDVLKEKEGGEAKPPQPPSSSKATEKKEEPEGEYTHINKKNITDAKELANANPLQGGKVGWQESVDAAINSLAKDAKEGESLPDVANRRIAEWGTKIDKELMENGKSTFNPTDEDLAVMSYYRTHLNQRLDGLKEGLNSEDEATRLNTLREAQDVQNKILGVDRVLSESGKVAGRSFYIRQMIAKMDAESNLQIRRMDIMRRQNGEPLSPEQEEAVLKIASEENKLRKEAETNIPKYSQEDFDAKVKKEVERLLKEKKPTKQKEKLSDSLKDVAKRIRTGNEFDKFLKGSQGEITKMGGIDIDLKELAAQALDYIAAGVKKGEDVAKLISEAVEKVKDKVHAPQFAKDLRSIIDNAYAEDKKDILKNIQSLSKDEKSDTITKSAVGKGLVNDLVNNYIDQGLRGGDVFKEMKKDLKEVFPDITDQDIRNAYLKEDNYRLEKKEQINKDKAEAQNQLKNIAKLEKKLEEIRKGQLGSKSISEKRRLSDQEKDLQKQIEKELNKQSVKLERSPKEEVDIKKNVAESHNKRMDGIIDKVDKRLKDENLSNEEKSNLKNIKNAAELAKVKLDTPEKIDNALSKSAESLRKAALDITDHPELLKEVSNSISELKKDASNATQDILLARYKRNLENKIKEADRKIEAQEFDTETAPIRTKSDAESIRLEIEARRIDAKYRRLQELAEQKNKKWWEKAASLGQTAYVQSLIGGIKTGGVVLSSGVLKQPLNTLTEFIGTPAHWFFPTLSKAAGAESKFSLDKEINRYRAHYGAIGQEGMKRIFKDSEKKLEAANNKYQDVEKKLSKAKEGSAEYKKLQSQLQTAKNEQTRALVKHESNFLFEWIGSNAWKDSADVLLKGTSKMEELFGRGQQVGWKDMTNYEKAEMVMSMMGSLHGYFKNFSARAEFAAAFTARLQNKAERGVDITQPDELLKTANESFVNFLMGKYQEDNFATTAMNRFSRLLEEIGNEPSNQGVDRNPKNQVVGKLAATAFRGKYPILRTGVNIGREAIVEYLLGSITGSALHGGEIAKGLFKGIKNGDPVIKSIKDQISNMSPDKVDLIFRSYRKGGIGLVGMALAAMGYIKFGGFYNEDDWKRKKGQLKQGDVEIFGHEFGHKSLVAKAFTHNPATMGALMVANARQVYERKISRGKHKGDVGNAVTEALVSDLEGAANIIPVLNNNFGNPLSNVSVPYGKAAGDIVQFFDTDKRGETIERDNSTWWNRFRNNTGFERFSPIKTKH